MTQKLIIGTLVILIISVAGFGIYSALTPENPVNEAPIISAQNKPQNTQAQGNTQAQNQAEPMVMAQENVGDVWTSGGTIIALDDYGFTLATEDAGDVYVELGPPTYWQTQGVALAEGDVIQVIGWNNGEQIHARVVTTESSELVLRSETSQPMWSGGMSNQQGQNGTHDSTQSGQVQFQVAPEDWVTISGTVTGATNGTIMMTSDDGTAYNLQMGQPNFWQSQGVTLEVNDEIEVLGFWMNGQFSVGDITKVATGEHIILRDPNGRQLWGGPGRNGNSNGQGQRGGQ